MVEVRALIFGGGDNWAFRLSVFKVSLACGCGCSRVQMGVRVKVMRVDRPGDRFSSRHSSLTKLLT